MFLPNEYINVSERHLIFTADSLRQLFDNTVANHIKGYRYFIDMEKVFMNELYKELEYSDFYQLPDIDEFMDGIVMPTDIKRHFSTTFKSLIKVLADSIISQLKGQMLIGFQLSGNYLIIANTSTLSIQEGIPPCLK